MSKLVSTDDAMIIYFRFLEGGDLRNYIKRNPLLSTDDNRRIAEKVIIFA